MIDFKLVVIAALVPFAYAAIREEIRRRLAARRRQPESILARQHIPPNLAADLRRFRTGRKLNTTIYEQEGAQPSDSDCLLGYGANPEATEYLIWRLNLPVHLPDAGRPE